MIELISDARCIRCDVCVRVCPTNVFEARVDAAPVIARQSDCQTCFMCELYCPTNALFVAPEAEQRVQVDEERLGVDGLLGSYREAVGWGAQAQPGARGDQSYRILAPPTPSKPATSG